MSARSPTLRRRLWLLAIQAALVLAVLAVFAPVRGFGFVPLDDVRYVAENMHVLAGLTSQGAAWAFTTTYESNWHPLTWLSLMLDAEIGGRNPGVYHRTSLLLHLASTLLLFHLLSITTGSPWRSGFVAALFGIHPLHVESVAWISERKDVLSTLLWLLATLAYVRSVGRRSLPWRALAACLLALGLMAKPMLVTLPIVLLMLDLWPLGRLHESGRATSSPPTMGMRDGRPLGRRALFLEGPWRRLHLEKLPLLALAAVSCVITLLAQSRGGSVVPLERVPLGARLANAAVSYIDYLLQALWPSGLAIPYPYAPERLTALRVLASAILLLGVSLLVLRGLRRFPFLAVGWFWYLVTLLPVIGIVQVGTQARADRYTYVPLIGIFIMVAWGAPELLAKLLQRNRGTAAAALALTALVLLGSVARAQVGFWRDGESLFRHTLGVTAKNAAAHDLLGLSLFEKGRFEEAIEHDREALRLRPDSVDARVNLSAALVRTGRIDEAAEHCREALRLRPDSSHAHLCLGVALMRGEDLEGASRELTETLRLAPDSAAAHGNLALILARQQRYDEALVHFREELRLRPANAEAHMSIAGVLARKGDLDGASAELSRALAIEPDSASAHKNLGVVLAQQGRLEAAIVQFEAAVRLDPSDTGAAANLARARALIGPGAPPGAGHR